MRVVIAGEDELSFRLAEALMGNHEVVLVCPESMAGPRLERLDVEAIHGAVTASGSLHRAGVEDAQLFVACTPYDEQNLVACVLAKRLGAERSVCFLFRSDFRGGLNGEGSLAESLDIDSVIRPAGQLAKEILRIVSVPGALDVEVFAEGKVSLFRHPVAEGAPLSRAPLKDVGLPREVVLVMARRGENIFVPKGNTQFQPGDKVTAMGSPAGLKRLFRRYLWADSRERGRDSRRATIVGGGEVGLAVALGMEVLGWKVKVIESNRKRCDEISRVLNSLVLHGDGGDLDLLEQEDIKDDAVLIAVTSNDERNLLVSLLAKQLGVSRIVTRASSHAKEKLFERVGVDVVRSAAGAAIRSVARRLVENREELLAELEHGDAMVLQLDVPAGFPPTALAELKAPEFAIVGAILREGEVLIPKGKDPLKGGDRILVFCTREYEEKTRRFFEKGMEQRS